MALDTIDLQDHDSPSAKDHSRHHIHPGSITNGAPAPHQAGALRNVEFELSEQHGRSPRASQDLSGKELQLLHDEEAAHERDPNENLLRNTGQNGVSQAEDEADVGDGEDGVDDDMIDKISSSPSIGEDGSYDLPLVPLGFSHGSLRCLNGPCTDCDSSSDMLSSSPFAETPNHFPLLFPSQAPAARLSPTKDHHQKVLYHGNYESSRLSISDDSESEQRDQLGPLVSAHRLAPFEKNNTLALDALSDNDIDSHDFSHLLLLADDPILRPLSPPTKRTSETSSPRTSSSWEDQTIGESDDDAKDISFSDDCRFVDSGWGGECLRDTEEIDFDFVYALHTFVATVEGQANATKGETMVLLDDSNSYWWLVRVQKDSSIGKLLGMV